MSALDDLKTNFNKFKGKRYALPVGLVLTYVLCTLIFSYSYAFVCFGSLIVAILGYYIPYFLGMRSKKKLAVWGLVLLILITIPFSVKFVGDQKTMAAEPLSSPQNGFQNATLSPLYGDSGVERHYSILITDSSITNVSVVITDYFTNAQYNHSMDQTAVAGGRLFTYNTTLPNSSEYFYGFIAFNGTSWKGLVSNYGPFQASDVNTYAFWIPLRWCRYSSR